MNAIIPIGEPAITMTSLELVQFINNQREAGESELRHDHFMAKVPQVLGETGAPKFRDTYRDVQNKERPCFIFPKREACLMAMSYSYDLQAKVFDRMTALEAGAGQPFKVPASFGEALRLAAEQAERIEGLAIERDRAIATKAQIGSKREATAMATASAAKREVLKLKDELGVNRRHATIIAVEKALGVELGSQFWRALKKWCDANGISATKVVDPRWGEVKAWPAEAWKEVKGVDLASLFPPQPGLQS